MKNKYIVALVLAGGFLIQGSLSAEDVVQNSQAIMQDTIKAVQCANGGELAFTTKNNHFLECFDSPSPECCDCLVAQSLCNVRNGGLRPGSFPTYCDQGHCDDPVVLELVYADLKNKVPSDFLVTMDEMLQEQRKLRGNDASVSLTIQVGDEDNE